MFLLRRPTTDIIRRFIERQRTLPLTYSEVGATRSSPPAGYRVDHNRIQLGAGEQTYARAVAALKQWQQFDLGWVRIAFTETPIEEDEVVAVVVNAFGLWSLNATRVVYVIDEANAKFGFAYGTLPGHVEKGEERFLIERLADDSVWYDIYAFSRPHHPLAQVAAPLVRKLQKQFARDSLRAMESAVR